MQFHGPTQILLQTRASRLRDVLTARDVNEIADTEPGTLQTPVELRSDKNVSKTSTSDEPQRQPETQMSYANVEAGGKVKFERAS